MFKVVDALSADILGRFLDSSNESSLQLPPSLPAQISMTSYSIANAYF